MNTPEIRSLKARDRFYPEADTLPASGHTIKPTTRYGKSILQTHSCFQKQLNLTWEYFILKEKEKGGAL
jgi:hypothetical protein